MEINKKKLKVWCAQNETTVTALAKTLGKSRVSVHRAASNPRRYGPTAKQLKEAINGK